MKNPIPDDWDGTSWCRWSICWPDSLLWRGLLIGAITGPYRGRFWDEKTGSIIDAQIIGNTIFDLNVPLQESIMSCSDLQILADALREGLQALANKPCCGGGAPGTPGGSGSQNAPAIAPAPSTNTDTGENIPPGFETRSAYLAYKCAVADWIINGLFESFENFSNVNFIAKTVAELAPLIAIALAIPVEGVAVFALVSLLVTIGITYAEETTGVLLDVVNTYHDELDCSLFNSTDAEEAEAALEAAFSEFIDTQSTNPVVRAYAKQIIAYMVSSASMNLLFDYDTSRNYPFYDCSGCESSCLQSIGNTADPGESGVILADYVDGNRRVVEIQGNRLSSESYWRIRLGTNACSFNVSIDVIAGNWAGTVSESVLYYGSMAVPPGSLAGFTSKSDPEAQPITDIIFYSDDPYTLRVTFSDVI